VPKKVTWSALFMNKIPVTKLGTNCAGWTVLFGDINIYVFIDLVSAGMLGMIPSLNRKH